MADRTINVNPSSDPQWTGGVLVKPSPESVININPINDNADCIANALEQLFWDVNNGGGGGGGTTDPQIEINRKNIGTPAGQELGTSLLTQINDVSSSVSNLSAFVGDSTYTSGLAKKVKDNETAIANNTSAIATNTGNISTLNTTVSNLSTTVGNHTTSISNLTTEVANDTAVLRTLGGGTLPTQSIQSIVDAAIAGYVPTVADGSITESKLANSAVTSAKIANGAVVDGKLANGSVNTNNIKDANVTTQKIADGAITSAKIADGTITYTDLSSGLQAMLGGPTDMTDYITSRGTFTSSADIFGASTSVTVRYATYNSGYSEIYLSYGIPGVFIQGTHSSTITVELPNEITFSGSLSELQIISYNMIVSSTGTDTEKHSCQLSVSSNTISFSVGGLDNSPTPGYSICNTRLVLVGDNFTITPPAS